VADSEQATRTARPRRFAARLSKPRRGCCLQELVIFRYLSIFQSRLVSSSAAIALVAWFVFNLVSRVLCLEELLQRSPTHCKYRLAPPTRPPAHLRPTALDCCQLSSLAGLDAYTRNCPRLSTMVSLYSPLPSGGSGESPDQAAGRGGGGAGAGSRLRRLRKISSR